MALTLATGGVISGAAVADDHETPTRQDVRDARAAVRDTADTVAEVRARLVVANQELERSSIAAAQAAEAFNGARWKAAEARKAARDARKRSRIAAADVRRQQEAYGDALVSSYEMSPTLTALAGIVDADGIDTVIERTTSLQNAESAMDDNYDSFRASATLADVATQQAQDAEDAAVAAEQEARDAKAAAQAAADGAAAQASSIATEKSGLIERLADLQHVSVRLAQQRQSALEEQAAAAAAAAAQREQEQQAQQAQQEQAATPDPTPHSAPTSDPTGTPTPDPPTPSTQPTPPAPASGASAAIAFARAQLGEPYVWGAAGPSSWDCSGLTMGAWAAGGKYLPHYSVAQYEQSTPISPSQLQPGDLVFWGSSSDPSSIYHVALYIGGDQIIQAPRTGEDVQVASMYYWIPPNFYARP
jgi:cell wall-associated NlpC family hydrolase